MCNPVTDMVSRTDSMIKELSLHRTGYGMLIDLVEMELSNLLINHPSLKADIYLLMEIKKTLIRSIVYASSQIKNIDRMRKLLSEMTDDTITIQMCEDINMVSEIVKEIREPEWFFTKIKKIFNKFNF